MTPYTILIGIISLAICFMPFYLAYRNQKKTQNTLISAISEMAEKNGCQIKEHSMSSNFSIGLSSDDRHVFYFQKNFLAEDDENELRVSIALDEYIKCKSEVIIRNSKSQKDPYSITERMSLLFYPTDNAKGILAIDFFNIENYFIPNGELKLLKTWEIKINSILEKNRPPVKINVPRKPLRKAA